MEQTANCLYCILYLCVWMFFLYYTYTKAEDQGRGGCLWVIIVLVFGPLGFAVFLFISLGDDWAGRSRDRREYRPKPGVYGGYPKQTVPPLAKVKADQNFRDDHLDKLIDDGNVKQARDYLKGMIELAKEMNDTQGLANYEQYKAKLKGRM